MNKQLYFLFIFYVFYIFALSIRMIRSRMSAVQSKEIDYKYFKDYKGDIPEKVAVVGRHFDNQFQLPVIFFILCFAMIQVMGKPVLGSAEVGLSTVLIAWLFVISRVAHTFIHLGKNKPLFRAKIYAIGWVMTLMLSIQLLVKLINS